MPDKLDEKHWTVWVAWTIMWWLRRQVSDLCFPIYVFQSMFSNLSVFLSLTIFAL